MFRPRIIPVLLLQRGILVKSIKFGEKKYIGDPINAVRIFNDLNVDEIVLLDIDASKEGRSISIDLIKEIGEEANMPFSVGGGIRDLETIKNVTQAGAERVIINSFALSNPEFIKEASENFGSSTISVCIDYKKNFWGKHQVYTPNSKNNVSKDPVEAALILQNHGAGEIIVQSVDKDGMMTGYDLESIKKFAASLAIPVVALGGAGTTKDLEDGFKMGYANGLAAGSMFVYKGSLRGVLIQYPSISLYNFNR
jgi:cyclase